MTKITGNLLRFALAIIFLSHSLHGVFHNNVTAFGEQFLDTVGFAPFGKFIAWAVILSQIVGSVLLLLGRYTKWVAAVFILTLINGIVLVHFKEGWYVVGAGRNGIEFSFLLIVCLLTIALPVKKSISSGEI